MWSSVSVVLRLGLGGLWLFAGLAKLNRFAPGSVRRREQSVREFGLLPARAVRPVAYLLPYAEVSLAVGLALAATARLAAAASAVLLLLFSAAMAINLRRGNVIDCYCFGQTDDARIAWGTVVRNLALAAAALGLAMLSPAAAPEIRDVFGLAAAVERASVTLPLALLVLEGTALLLVLHACMQTVRAYARTQDGPRLWLREGSLSDRLLRAIGGRFPS